MRQNDTSTIVGKQESKKGTGAGRDEGDAFAAD